MRALAFAFTLLLTFSSHAYVRSRTQHGTAVFWPGSCVYVQPDSDGTPDMTADVTFATIQKCIQNWQSLTVGCGYLAMNYDTPAKEEAHLDGKNVVKFRTDKWCHPDDTQNHGVCYDKSAAAITTVFYLDRPKDKQDGYIIDADVELNNLNFTFINVVAGQPNPSPRMGTSIADLENTLTHELGHLQGLDHTCKDSATPANEVDGTGQPPPSCSTLAALPLDQRTAILDATMFNSASPGEIKKRSPEADDVAGICAIYPLDQASKHSTCKHTDLNDYTTGGCQMAPGPIGRAAFFLGAFAWIAVRLRRRRNR